MQFNTDNNSFEQGWPVLRVPIFLATWKALAWMDLMVVGCVDEWDDGEKEIGK